jgi:hypothetical protein
MGKLGNSYILPIYRRADGADEVDAPAPIGMVEDPASGTRQAFHNVQESWRILQLDCENDDVFTSAK